ncbi:MAG: DUF2637 domain-containing protein [Actinobacteria bacterium]|nr:DUF2637 domain-containing protein [Actinomycetota bacterium]
MRAERDPYRTATALAVTVVALIAAGVSYLHIARLALAYGQEPVAAYLLPLSIDGVVATSSLVMLRSARAGVASPWLSQLGLVLSVGATLGANIASGLGHGWIGALLSGWPAIGFVLSAETAISMSRRRGRQRSVAPTGTTPARATARRNTATRTRISDAATRERAMAELARQPGLSGAELGRLLGASPRTGQRLMTSLNGHALTGG